MSEAIVLKSSDPIIETLNFKPFRSITQRRVEMFLPKLDEPQTKHVTTPWGSDLEVKKGDFLVSEMDRPQEAWPVNPDIFDSSYMLIGSGICVKRAVTLLVPLIEVTGGDEDQLVEVHSLEGMERVRAGDFFLAKGIQGEIWPYPKEKVEKMMRVAEKI